MRILAGSFLGNRYRFLSVVVIVALAAAVLGVPGVTPQAQAQNQTPGAATSDGVNFGDCDFRNGTGAAETWANQICWLDMRGFDQNG